MLLIQIHLHTIRRRHQGVFYELPRKDSEYMLGPALIQAYRKKNFDSIYVLNGPGSFTNLRLGCLVINTLTHIIPQERHIYTISKLDFWTTIYQHQQKKGQGVLYIGQRKNAWLWDSYTGNHKIKTIDELKSYTDIQREDFGVQENEQYIMKVCEDQKTPLFIDITLGKENVSLGLHQWQWELVTMVKPHYVIHPNISIPKKRHNSLHNLHI